jgi:hypothetical protein
MLSGRNIKGGVKDMKKLAIAAALVMLSASGLAVADRHDTQSQSAAAARAAYERGAADSTKQDMSRHSSPTRQDVQQAKSTGASRASQGYRHP